MDSVEIIGGDRRNRSGTSINGWTEKNCEIVETWKQSLQESSFVYNDTAAYYERMMQITLILSLLLGTLMTVASALTITLGSLNNTWVVLGFNVGMLVASAIIATANGLEKVFSWDDKQKLYENHSQRLYSLWLTLDSEMSLARHQRFIAGNFVKRKNSEYAIVMQQGPQISMEDFNKSLHKYKNNLYDEELWMRRFNIKNKELEEIV
jgi:hypothetical protein